jgi:ribosome-associated protein
VKLLQLVVRALDDKKAEDLRILDVRAQSSITDYLVLATGTSEPHLRALRLELEKALDGARVPIIGVENTEGSGWAVFDAFEVMVHLFTVENRAKYRLELLWKDAIDLPIAKLLAGRNRLKVPGARISPRTKRL